MSIKVIKLDNGTTRVVYGDLVDYFDLDYTQPSLKDLQKDIDLAIGALNRTQSIFKKLKNVGKNIIVHRGGSHLDVVDDGKGSLNWLIVDDHPYVNLEE